MESLGIQTQIIETPGHPVVFGSIGGESDKTLLIYGHYDVQPPEPLDKWDSDPFDPVIRDGRLYARGSADNKGQLYAHLAAIESILAIKGKLPVSVKFLIEGEEEMGSPNLEGFILAHRELLESDAQYTSDASVHDSGKPMIILGMKGMVYLELTAVGPNRDRHSAEADYVPSPVWDLVWALNSMKGSDHQVKVAGFMDSVVPPSEREKEIVAGLPVDREKLMRDRGITSMVPTVGDNFYAARMLPTFNISGFSAGYTGEGTKTVLPAEARVKLDIRLAADQKPREVYEQVKKHLADHGFHNIRVDYLNGLEPSRTDIDHPYVAMICQAVAEAFGEDVLLFPRIIGSGPDYLFTDRLGLPSVIVPYANADCGQHGPNENLVLEQFYKGIRTSATVISRFADLWE
jgi:acetylornithine deacetylase/succinyl-diaminopimelate desuccinylase-like protein